MNRTPLFLVLAAAFACQSPSAPTTPEAKLEAELEAKPKPDPLGRFERDAGWIALFDGLTTNGWRGVGQRPFPESGWNVVDGSLHHSAAGGGGDIVTVMPYTDFEFEFEWMTAVGANSGVKYRVRDQQDDGYAFGLEYQVLDDRGHPNGQVAKTSAGALYDVYAVSKGAPPIAKTFNHGRIVSRGDRIEHWLNGERLVDAQIGSDEWNTLVAASKFAGNESYGTAGPGHIVLQDHGDEVWFRNLRLRELPMPAASGTPLLTPQNLAEWIRYGDASYTWDESSVLGAVTGGAQSFLVSPRDYGDFILEIDVKTEEPGNSGIQIRSHEHERGHPFGYQVEIDPSKRSWSGGLYDEGRRAWLYDLKNNEAGREAFVYQDWNEFRIEAIGPWIRVRVNGVVTTDYFDTEDLAGFFGLQVHSGRNTRVRWRDAQIVDLGTRGWEPLANHEPGSTRFVTDGETLVLEREESTPEARHYPVVKYEALAAKGALHVHLGDGQGCTNTDQLAVEDAGRWCVRPDLATTFKPGEWNAISVGFDRGSCAIQVNGRTQRVLRGQAGANGTTLELFADEAQTPIEVREVTLLGEPQFAD